MAKNRIFACWLLLMMLMLGTTCFLATGEVQARYENTVTWQTVMDASVARDQVSSDLLENVSKPPVTVLLSELVGEEYEVSFTLKSGVPVTGPLNWAVDRYEYVEAEMTVGEGEDALVLQPGDDLEIPGNSEGVTVTMTLRPTTKAMTENHPAMDINIQVAWGNTLQATFLTFLNVQDFGIINPEVPEVTDPTEPEVTDPTNPTEPEATNPTDPTEPEATDPTEPTEPEATNPTDPTEPEVTEPTEDPGNTQEEQTDTNAHSSAAIKLAGAKPDDKAGMKTYRTEPEPSGDGTEDGTDEGAGDGTAGEEPLAEETTGEEAEVPDPKVEIQTVRSFKTDDVLLVEVYTEGQIETIEFGMGLRVNPEAEEELESIPFPRHLRYSLDNGESYYHLYQDSLIYLTPSPNGKIYILLDWTRVNLNVNEVELAAAACCDGEMVASARTTTAPQTQYAVTLSAPVLDTTEPLIINIPQSWQGYTLEYQVQMLISPLLADGSYGPLEYQTLDLGEDAEDPEKPAEENPEDPSGEASEEPEPKMLIVTQTDAGLEICIGEKLPPAGTYRVNMIWTSGDESVEQTQVIFYINYSANQETLQTGGAEQ